MIPLTDFHIEQLHVLLTWVNILRKGVGVEPVAWHDRLHEVATKHARDMSTRGFFAHVCPDGKGPRDRATAAGYIGMVGENIQMSRRTLSADKAFNGWVTSPGHFSNMTHPAWRYVGLGTTFELTYWVQLFGDV